MDMTYSKIEDKDVGCVSHGFVQDDDKNHKKVSNEANKDNDGEDHWNNYWNYGHQNFKMSPLNIIVTINFFYFIITFNIT